MPRWIPRFRYRLRTLLILTTVCALVAFWFRPMPPRPNIWLVDAVGNPLGRARIEFYALSDDDDPLRDKPLPEKPYAFCLTDQQGGFHFRHPKTSAAIAVRVEHDDYGIALIRFPEYSDFDLLFQHPQLDFYNRITPLPLAAVGSTAAERAVRGRVVDESGNPVAGAEVRCASVRTPGEGLLSPVFWEGFSVVTGADGCFRLYFLDLMARRDPTSNPPRPPNQGELIPPNSRYELRIDVPHDLDLVPLAQGVYNIEPVTLRLQRATNPHTFQFESPDGGVLDATKLLDGITITYQPPPDADGESSRVQLSKKIIRDGGRLMPGLYEASYRDSRGKAIRWNPLSVTPTSLELLRFTISKGVLFSGRVVDGFTGEPLVGTSVGGYDSTSGKNLATITNEQWRTLGSLPTPAALDSDGWKPLLEQYGFKAITKTNADGRFQLNQEPDQEFYAVLAFARDRLPFELGVYGFRKQLENSPQVETGSIRLYPAARLMLHPVYDFDQGQGPSLMARWRPLKDEQPDWFWRFQKAVDESEQRQYSQTDWLKLNQSQAILVPAGLRFQVKLSCPYDDQWSPEQNDRVFQLAEGEEADYGQVALVPSIQLSVLVVDSLGEPVEGAPVRRWIGKDGDNSWSVVHNCNALGLARFYVPPRSTGKFAVSYHPPSGKRIHVEVKYDAKSNSPDEAIRIELAPGQRELIQGSKD